jgi:hypothetical protein
LSTVSLSIGTVLGFSAILLPQLEEENALRSKSAEASWIGDNDFPFLFPFFVATFAD